MKGKECDVSLRDKGSDGKGKSGNFGEIEKLMACQFPRLGCFHQRNSREREERPRNPPWGTPTVYVWKKQETLAKDQPAGQKQKQTERWAGG